MSEETPKTPEPAAQPVEVVAAAVGDEAGIQAAGAITVPIYPSTPPEVAHMPTATTNLGSGICS